MLFFHLRKGIRDLRVERFGGDHLKVGNKEVLIEIKAVGICGSDVHYYAHGQCGPFLVRTSIYDI